MHSASLSIKVFGAYVFLTGVALLLAPAMMLALFAIPAPQEIWVRVLGALAIVVGYYYWACGRAGAEAFFRATVGGRVGFFLLCALLVVAFQAPAQLLIFGVVDLLGAGWTFVALSRAAKARA